MRKPTDSLHKQRPSNPFPFETPSTEHGLSRNNKITYCLRSNFESSVRHPKQGIQPKQPDKLLHNLIYLHLEVKLLIQFKKNAKNQNSGYKSALLLPLFHQNNCADKKETRQRGGKMHLA